MNFKTVSTAFLSASMVMGFCQCSQQNASAPQPSQSTISVSGLKMAYIDVDSLLLNYDYYQDLMEEMTRKEENYRLILAEEINKFEKEYSDHQKKLENGVYSSRDRAESEQNRLAKKQQAIRDKNDKYSQEIMDERESNSQKISETVDKFIKEYNKEHGYNFIFSKASLMFADETLNITADILNGLNSQYNAPAKK